jgi:anaerobic magnesium-protoporphyrin IX monomethyl ester cyclase
VHALAYRRIRDTLKVLLVNPPHLHMFSRGQPRYYAEEQALLPPLGLLCVAAYVLEQTRYSVSVLDMPLLKMDQKGFRAYLLRERPDLVGISCLTNILYDTLETARTVKAVSPSTPVILGGHHTQLYPRETLRQGAVDGIVLGAGEVAFTRLLRAFEATGRIPRLPGVIPKGEGVEEGAFADIQCVEDPDSLPFPARHLTPFRKYYSATSISPPTTVVITSFGCPFRCIFCNTSRVQKMVTRSPMNVVDELAGCVSLGIREFTIQDENFAVNRARVVAIAEEIIRRKLDIVWSFKSRVDLVDREMLRIVRRAGCSSIHFGVESGDHDVLVRIRKDITPDQVRHAFRLAREEGLQITAAFMIGFPEEDRPAVLRTIEFALELDPNYVQFAITIPLPGTELYRLAFEKGLFEKDYWREFAEHPVPHFKPPGWYEIFSQEELEELLDMAYRRFYLRPKYIWRRLKGLHNLSELKRNFRIGTRILLRR